MYKTIFGVRELAPAFCFWVGTSPIAPFGQPEPCPLESTTYEMQLTLYKTIFGVRELAPAFCFWVGIPPVAPFGQPEPCPLESIDYEMQFL